MKDKVNLVPALLHKFFKTERMSTFYDKKNLEWSDDFQQEMFSYVEKSFAFAQFIEPAIFYGSANDNYCYKEYTPYTDSISAFSAANQLADFKPVYFFIISNPANSDEYNFKPAGVEDESDLGKWATAIRDKQYFTFHTRMSESELQLKIQKASNKIMDTKKAIIDSFLASF